VSEFRPREYWGHGECEIKGRSRVTHSSDLSGSEEKGNSDMRTDRLLSQCLVGG